jgi:hypothetical protein
VWEKRSFERGATRVNEGEKAEEEGFARGTKKENSLE